MAVTATHINPDRIILEATDVVRQYHQSDEVITAVNRANMKVYDCFTWSCLMTVDCGFLLDESLGSDSLLVAILHHLCQIGFGFLESEQTCEFNHQRLFA